MSEQKITSFIYELIKFYKILVFSRKEFVISKRIIKVTVSLGSCFSVKNKKEMYESFIEIEFWLKVLLSLMDEQEIYEKTLELCKKTEEIIKSMEDEL